MVIFGFEIWIIVGKIADAATLWELASKHEWNELFERASSDIIAICSILWVIVVWIRAHNKKGTIQRPPITLSLLVFFLSAFLLFKPTVNEKSPPAGIPDFLTFNEIYQYVPRLGEPRSQVIISPDAYIEVHENAVLLWLQPLNRIIRLNPGPSFTFTSTIDMNPISDPNQLNDEYMQRRLGLDVSCKPPLGGPGRLYETNPTEWKTIGCRTWNCSLPPQSISYQIFENGYVIHGVPRFENQDLGRDVLLLKDPKAPPQKVSPLQQSETGTWVEKGSSSLAPLCKHLTSG